MNAMIDTLKVAKSFEDAGFAKAQAESLAVAIGEAAGVIMIHCGGPSSDWSLEQIDVMEPRFLF